MQLNEKQREGLEIAVSRYRVGAKFTVVAGYANHKKAKGIKL